MASSLECKSAGVAPCKSTMTRSSQFEYRYLRLIGQGGMANVFLFERALKGTGTKRAGRIGTKPQLVAVKQARTDCGPEETVRINQMFDMECENVRSVSGGHMVHVYGVELVAGIKSIVMEWVDGCTLGDILRVLKAEHQLQNHPARSCVSAEFATRVLRGLLLGLKDIHSFRGEDNVLQCLIHRDLTPKNVLLSCSGEVKIADFGISKRGAGSDGFQTHARNGTKGFIAPELRTAQAASSGLDLEGGANAIAYDARLDLYHVGLILFNLLFAESFEDWRVSRGLSLTEAGPVLREKLQALGDQDPALVALVGDLLEVDPELRIGTAQEGFNRIRQLYFGGQPDPESAELVNRARARPAADQEDTQVAEAATPVPQSVPESVEQAQEPDEENAGPVTRKLVVAGALALGAGLIWYVSDVVWADGRDAGPSKAALFSAKVPDVDSASFDDDSGAPNPVDIMASAAASLEAQLASLLERLEGASPEGRTELLGTMEHTFSLYLQLVSDKGGEDAEPSTWRCRAPDARVEHATVLPPICQTLSEHLEVRSSESGVSEAELWEHLAQVDQNPELVKKVLETLGPWKLQTVETLLAEVDKVSRAQAPGSSFGGAMLVDARGLATGFGFDRPVPSTFRQSAWTSSLRTPVCKILDAESGWTHLLSASEQRKLDPRARYFEGYNQAWGRWFASMHWNAASKEQGAGPLSDLQRLAAEQDGLVAHFLGKVQQQGTIQDWACAFQPDQEPHLLPFAKAARDMLEGDDPLASRFTSLAAMLASSVDQSGKANGGFQKVRSAYAVELAKTKRVYTGEHKRYYEALTRSMSRLLNWWQGRVKEAPAPEPAAPLNFEQRWCQQIQRPFEKKFAGRYPFSGRGRRTASLEEVRKFFHPSSGQLWRRLAELDGYVDRQGNRFVGVSAPADGSKPLSRHALAFLSQARALSQALFSGRGRGKPFTFELSFPESDSMDEVVLSLGQGARTLRLDRPNRLRFSWPPSAPRSASMIANASGEKVFRISGKKGRWSTLWLFEQGKVVSDAKGRVRLRWQDPQQSSHQVYADLRPLDGGDLLFGPDWSPSGLLRVLRLRAPAKPFQGGHDCKVR